MINPVKEKFEDYQVKYETILPIKVKKALTYAQIHVHHAMTAIDKFLQVPEFALRTMQFSVAILSFFPMIQPFLETPGQFCKDIKNLISLSKGLKTIDGFLNFKFLWKPVILNISGMIFLIITNLILIDRCKLLNLCAIKTGLAAIPVFGVLPWGGWLPFSITGMMGVTTLFAWDKGIELEKNRHLIKTEKIGFWSQPLDLHAIPERQIKKYQAKILKLEKEVDGYHALIQEGRLIESELNRHPDQSCHIFACQKALDELTQTLVKREANLKGYQEKFSQWELLEKNWIHIDSGELENFREAKQLKWEGKLNQIEGEKRVNLISIVSNIIIISRQALVIISVASGYGIVNLPFLVNAGLDAFIAGSSIANFFMKASIKKIKTLPVNLTISQN